MLTHLLIPLMSLGGPIYFGVRDWPVVLVLIWAGIWNTLRFIATWKQSYAALLEEERGKPLPWTARHPSVSMAGVFLTTLFVHEAAHLGVYWITRGLVENSNS